MISSEILHFDLKLSEKVDEIWKTLAVLIFLASIVLFVLFIIALFKRKPKAKLFISSIVCLVLAMILIPTKDKEEKPKAKETTQQASTEVKEEPKKRRSEKGRT